jgi:hypothetical protein
VRSSRALDAGRSRRRNYEERIKEQNHATWRSLWMPTMTVGRSGKDDHCHMAENKQHWRLGGSLSVREPGPTADNHVIATRAKKCVQNPAARKRGLECWAAAQLELFVLATYISKPRITTWHPETLSRITEPAEQTHVRPITATWRPLLNAQTRVGGWGLENSREKESCLGVSCTGDAE